MARRLGAVAVAMALFVQAPCLAAQQFSLITEGGMTARPYSKSIGARRVFICRPNVSISRIWGTDVYDDGSPICSAAVHAGVITQAQGGLATIVIGAGSDNFTASTRNGVTSTAWTTMTAATYTFDRTMSGRGEIDWVTNATRLPPDFQTPLDLTCPAADAKVLADVAVIYGTDIYTDDSPICVAALHAGVITQTGGVVHFVAKGRQSSFVASTRNGVSSRVFGAWEGSFGVSPGTAVASVSTPTSIGVTAGALPQGSVTSPSTTTATQSTSTSPVTAVTTMTTTATATPVTRTINGFKAVFTSGTTASITWDKTTWMTQGEEFFFMDVWAENNSCPTDIYIDPKTCKRSFVDDVGQVKFDATGLDPSKNYSFRLSAMAASARNVPVWNAVTFQEAYVMRSSILASPTLNGPINTKVMSGGPAPVLNAITGTTADAALTWSMSSGTASRFEVWRKAGTGTAELRTTTAYDVSNYGDQITDPRLTYSYQVKAIQPDGTYGLSSWVNYTPPKLMNPGSFGGRLSGDREATLFWQPVTGVDSFRVDGPGLPTTGRFVSGTSLRINGLGAGSQSWRVASIYPNNLMDLTTRPTATVTIPPSPWRSVPYLSMRNGAGSLMDEMTYYTTLISLKQMDDCTALGDVTPYPWLCGNILNQLKGTPVDVAFADMNSMGAGRHVYCSSSGIPPATETRCWASTHGPEPGAQGWGDPSTALGAATGGDPNRGWTLIRQGRWGTLFAAAVGLPALGAYSTDQFGPYKADVVLDLEGPKRLPHACLACHGGKYDASKGMVVGASLIPIDPGSLVFSTSGTLTSAQEESVRQINQIVLNSSPAPAVAAYIRGLYGGNVAVAGTRSIANYVPPGWAQAPDLYRKVVKPYCQGCHLQQQTLDFASYQNFVNAKAAILTSVCTTRTMPHSEAALIAFWRDGGRESLPDYLASALGLGKCAP